MPPIVPPARVSLVDQGGLTSRAFYSFFQGLAKDVGDLSAQVGNVTVAPPAESGVIVGNLSVTAVGSLSSGAVNLALVGDAAAPGNTYFYGTSANGGKGWRTIYSALAHTTDTTLTDGADGTVTIGLADLADSGTGAALVKLTRDGKGRISGTSSATTSDLAEGTNLYFTSARVYTAAKAVLVAGSNVTITADDTVNTLTIAATGGGGGGGGPGTDPLIDYVVALIPLAARNRSTGFVDMCGNVLVDMAKVCGDSTVTQYGFNTMLNAGGGLTMFSTPGSGVVSTPALLIGTRDFCWEIDVAVTGTLAAFSSLVSNRPSNAAQTGTTCIGITSANQLYIYSEAAFVVNPTAATVVTSPGSFNKIAYDVVGGVGYLYLNGALVGSGAQPALIYTSRVSIGANYDGTETIPANFANFRFTLGVNRYAGASSYTPLTAPFPFA